MIGGVNASLFTFDHIKNKQKTDTNSVSRRICSSQISATTQHARMLPKYSGTKSGYPSVKESA
jgi:hypothetical protein